MTPGVGGETRLWRVARTSSASELCSLARCVGVAERDRVPQRPPNKELVLGRVFYLNTAACSCLIDSSISDIVTDKEALFRVYFYERP